MAEINENIEKVRKAFSRQSPAYDIHERNHEILQWMRTRVQAHALNFVRPGDHILELNAGTGIDAVFFAMFGCRVHATDISDGMLWQLRRKVERLGLQERITVQKCSFTCLNALGKRDFDYIFSNFGGLNCIADLTRVTRHFPDLLKPGGFVTMVLMPPLCPWELALIFRGHFKTATRRLHRRGVLSHIEGVYFKSYYFHPRQVLSALGAKFQKVSLRGLASLIPPPYMENFPRRYPGLYRFLTNMDDRVSQLPPFNSFADHFILTVQYLP